MSDSNKTTRSVNARWRKEPNETGLARVCQSPRGFDLTQAGKILARVRRTRNGGWFWYMLSHNTCDNPVATADEAKAEVMLALIAFRSKKPSP